MKKTMIKLITTTVLIAFALTTTSLQAQPEKKETGKEEKKGPAINGMPFHGKLSAVDTKAKTITIEGKEKSRTFEVTSQTRIMKAGKPAVLEDAKVGEEVGGFAEKKADDKFELRSLRIGPRPEGEKRPERKKEGAEKKQ